MEEQSNEVIVDVEDLQCGHIYLHEPTMMLKFFCLFCEKTYDDINCYCTHLSEHMYSASLVKDEPQGEDEAEVGYDSLDMDTMQHESETSDPLKEEEMRSGSEMTVKNGTNAALKTEAVAVTKDKRFFEKSFNDKFFEFSEEELDEDEEESRQFLFEADNGAETVSLKLEHDNSVDAEYVEALDAANLESIDTEDVDTLNAEDMETLDAEYLETLDTELETLDEENQADEVKEHDTDFENLIGNAKILKSTKPQPPKIKHVVLSNKVKTYKIITLKNQIEELYSLVKQARISGATHAEARIKNAICSIKKGIERTTQIIGETIITSLPVEVDVERTGNAVGDQYKCHACDKVFRTQHSLSLHGRAHYMESQSDVKVAHKCTDCNELFNKVRDLQLHIQKVHYPEGYKCHLCHKILRSMSLLEVHMKKMHLQSKDFRCRLCGRTDFTTTESFEEHSKTHVDKNLFKCYICGKQYNQDNNLKQHVTRCADRVPERCVVCSKVTTRINQHMKMHSPRPSRLLQCSICNKTFSFSSALSRHTKVMHKLPRTVRTKVVRNENVNNTGKRRRRTPKANPKSLAPTEAAGKQVVADDTQAGKVAEGPKKVVVEMIENVMNRKTVVEDGIFENMDCTVARYETIAAVQSITSATEHG